MGLLTRFAAPRVGSRGADDASHLEPEPGLPRRPKDPAYVGDYRVLRLLGEGGMGTVYLGEAVDGRRVAVKVIQAEFARDPEFRERFRAETAHARQVEEAYTAAVLDADPDAAMPYLVTEFVPGPTLRAAVNAGGPLGADDLARLAVGMAAALTAIHGAGIAHHDLKPGNVLLGPSGPRVIDFGIANGFNNPATNPGGRGGRGRGRRGRAAQDVSQVGTPGYMAPEQASGGTVGPSADVFSWAAVMTFAASGAPPFGEGSPEELLRRVKLEEPDVSALPDALIPLVVRAFSKSPADRPSAGDLLLALMGERQIPEPPARVPAALPPAARDRAPESQRALPAPTVDRAEPADQTHPERTAPVRGVAPMPPVEDPLFTDTLSARPSEELAPLALAAVASLAEAVVPVAVPDVAVPDVAVPAGNTPAEPAADLATEPAAVEAGPALPTGALADEDVAVRTGGPVNDEPVGLDPATVELADAVDPAEVEAAETAVSAEDATAVPSTEPARASTPVEETTTVADAGVDGRDLTEATTADVVPTAVAVVAAEPTAAPTEAVPDLEAVAEESAEAAPAPREAPATVSVVEPAVTADETAPGVEAPASVEPAVSALDAQLAAQSAERALAAPLPEPSADQAELAATEGSAAGVALPTATEEVAGETAVVAEDPAGVEDPAGTSEELEVADHTAVTEVELWGAAADSLMARDGSPTDAVAEPLVEDEPTAAEAGAPAGTELALREEESLLAETDSPLAEAAGPRGPTLPVWAELVAAAGADGAGLLSGTSALPVIDAAPAEPASEAEAGPREPTLPVWSEMLASAGPDGVDLLAGVTGAIPIPRPVGEHEALALSPAARDAVQPDVADDPYPAEPPLPGAASAEPISVESAWEVPTPSPFDNIVWSLPASARRDPYVLDDLADDWPPLLSDDAPGGGTVEGDHPVSRGAADAVSAEEDPEPTSGPVPVLDKVPALDVSVVDVTSPLGVTPVAGAVSPRPDVDIMVRYVDGVVEVAAREVALPEQAPVLPAVAEITVAGVAGVLEERRDEPATAGAKPVLDADDPLGVGPVLAARDEPRPGAELVLAPWPDLAPSASRSAGAATRSGDPDLDGVIDVGPDWIQETATPEPVVPPISIAELHALWDDEVDLDPRGSAADALAEPALGVGAELSTIGSAWPALPTSASTELAPYEAVPASDLERFLAPPLALTSGTTGGSGAAGVASQVTVSSATVLPVSPAAVGSGGSGGSGTPGARARARAERRGAARRRVITVIVAVIAAVIAAGLPLALSHGGGANASITVADASMTPSARPTPSATPSPTPSPTPTAVEVTPSAQTSGAPGVGQPVPGATEAPGTGGPNRPGTPGLFLQSYAGGVSVTVNAPYNGGSVTSYQITATPGGVRTLNAPGTVQIAINGCAESVVTVRAIGPDGTSDAATPLEALSCVPPGQPSNVIAVPANGNLVVGWDVPTDVGGNEVNLQYVVTVYRTGPSGVTSDTFVVYGHSYTRDAPSSSDPYIRIEVAARNAAGVGQSVVAWTSH
jgi:serine/threonine protein kinase